MANKTKGYPRDYIINNKYYSVKFNNKFKTYLAGLFEGNAKKLLEIIGSGYIIYKPKDNACILVVSLVVGLKKIVSLINGELRTPKIHRSFSVQHTKIENNAKKRKISCRLRIEQIMLDPVTGYSYLKVLTNIAKFLNCNLLTRKQKSTGNEYYIITASSKISLDILVKYLEVYPIYSSKYLDYKD
ncbi:hypothetical protein ASPZODRAFT_155587 [Penicilliopsis zonata CBS 506.65]|uniref:Homing endonuclease LAGLIDADG domain-containing protein n=1 Tax=Penicilliopsis zonata CBS 506.65 TaxID=1073090 RepID=A0A1L9S4A8_9EURO|nr:hypothetical protein ASPZODRAFT_155587 [Penicilliopsis zonata CBS 506.65]OJJ41986.1 hypothetical protein ASPZODRAFT_155587 [Penicilliopsis zonata CBS 506.65]